tara:strand:- start:486 stop:662 length:177 start_codon:yes stop_codon:yes gene_type:complete
MKVTNNQVILCCGKGGCPTLSKTKEGLIQIKDDFGSSVLLKEEEANLIHKALGKLKAK